MDQQSPKGPRDLIPVIPLVGFVLGSIVTGFVGLKVGLPDIHPRIVMFLGGIVGAAIGFVVFVLITRRRDSGVPPSRQ